MGDLLLSAGSCFILGVITTAHPCPFATNMAAISLLTSWSGSSRKSLWYAGLFIAGFLGAYLTLAFLLGMGIYSIPAVGVTLQRIFPVVLGPFLILTGMLQAELIGVNSAAMGRLFKRVNKASPHGLHALPMGAVMALSFCPATAGLFFGVLMPLALGKGQILLFPLLFATGASLPMVFTAHCILAGLKWTNASGWQRMVPKVAGWIAILIGIYISIQNIYMPML